MRLKAVLAIAAGTLALAGCPSMPLAPRDTLATVCEQTECHITVYVTADNQIRVDKDPLAITKRNINIHWDIDQDTTEDYKFTTDGIKFGGDAGDQFDCNRVGGGKKFVCKAKNSTRGDFKYSIKLEGPRTITLDPTIKNQG